MKKGILLHEADDDVGVAAMDLEAGEVIQAVTLDRKAPLGIQTLAPVRSTRGPECAGWINCSVPSTERL